ncbi:MAG: hypothetical protein K6T16_02970 [Candidatus Pacearchaeota archaeon]|nr:hypothetical protein [Candidatus Pacearchaeota archaeon]
MIEWIGLLPLVIFNDGTSEECKSLVNRCSLKEVQTKHGPVIYVLGHVDIGEGEGIIGLRNSLYNDYTLNINPYLYATGRPPIPVTNGLIDTTIMRIDGSKCNFTNYDEIQECCSDYGFQLCQGGVKWEDEEPEEPVVKTDTVKGPPVVIPGDTIRQPIVVPGDTISYPVLVPIPIPVDTTKAKKSEGFWTLDETKGYDFGIGGFYRSERNAPNFFAIVPYLNFRTSGKDLRARLNGELSLLTYENDETKALVNASAGLGNRYLEGGAFIVNDVNNNVNGGPYVAVALPIGPVTLSGKGGIGFGSEFHFTQFLEGALNYASPKDNYELEAWAKNKVNPYRGEYTNSAGINMAFGNKAKLLAGLSGETNYGADIWNAQVSEGVKSIELGLEVGGKWEFDKDSGLYILGHAKGQHSGEESHYKVAEGGAKLGFYKKIK